MVSGSDKLLNLRFKYRQQYTAFYVTVGNLIVSFETQEVLDTTLKFCSLAKGCKIENLVGTADFFSIKQMLSILCPVLKTESR